MIHRVGWLVLLGLHRLAHGKLFITEIMIDPINEATAATTNWFELYNTESVTVPLDQWQVRVCHPNFCQTLTLSTTKSIGPQGYVVIGNNAGTATNGGITMDINLVFTPFPPDGRGFNALAIYQPSTVTEDFLQWSSNEISTAHPNYSFQSGASLARVNAVGSALDVNNWTPSTTPINCRYGADTGTPGKANTFQCPASSPGCGLLGLGLVCLNGCGILGRLLGLCQS